MTTARLTCTQPDRHVPRLVCGYPLPCPHHTVIVDVREQSVTLPLVAGAKLVLPAASAGRLGEVAQAMAEPPPRKRRRRGR